MKGVRRGRGVRVRASGSGGVTGVKPTLHAASAVRHAACVMAQVP